MTPEEKNVEILREAYRLWHKTKGGSVDYWMDLMADNIRFRSLAGGEPGLDFTRECCIKEEVRHYFEGLGADWEMIHYTAEEFIAQKDRVVMLGSCAFRHRHTGNILETPKADFFRFSNGQIVDFMEFYDTAKALAGSAEN
jgi:ketosteroid isomerase-like protein